MAAEGDALAYDLVVWFFTVVFDLFFRQILPRGSFRIPKKGPVIFVAAPHANQFVDPMILMQQVRSSSGRRISFLIAESSLRRRFIGFMARATHAIGVVRAQDNLVKGSGSIRVDNSSGDNWKLRILGTGSKFTKECMVNGHISLPNSLGMGDISEIVSDTEIILRKEFKSQAAYNLLLKGTTYKRADRVNHSDMYKQVFSHLHDGGCLGIFPEGGSHDRTDLLPLKAGVAIMALGALAEDPDCNVKIVPCGMNYFHAHKFRSRAVVEFGVPITISPELVDKYKSGGDLKKEAVKELLDLITVAVRTVTVTCLDYDTLMTVQAARRLYLPKDKQLPLPVVVELTRRFVDGYTHYKDHPRVIHVREAVAAYNRQLSNLGLKDHQVETAALSPQRVIGRLVWRVVKLVFLLVFSLPGAILFSPVFVAIRRISNRKAAQALKASTVKIAANDVLATWKLLVALGLAPLVYTAYTILATYLSYRYEIVDGSFLSLVGVAAASYVVLPAITYAALVIGETGMDIFKSLRPLALALDPSRKNTLAQIKATRVQLTADITDLVNEFGPDLYPDFTQERLVRRASWTGPPTLDDDAEPQSRRQSIDEDQQSEASASISRVNSEYDLADVPLFSSQYDSSSPGSSHSRATSESSIEDITENSTGRESFQSEVSRRIRGAIADRRRRQQDED